MTDDETSDEEIISKLVQDAITMHEILMALLKAGWTERQAIIYIVESGYRYNHGR